MLTLQPITAAAFQSWQQQAIKAYAQDKVTAGTWPAATALTQAQAEYQRLLPAGRETTDELIWTIYHEQQAVGTLWVHWDQTAQSFFIYDIIIQPEFQNQGFGQATLQALNQVAAKKQVQRISLHVFASNQRAYYVYQKMGFVPTDISMTKYIKPASAD
ncbi:GNAT family N-acetyltransferase [Lapidilactobacillus wuchangensis]|uniref:GNAT family N-acetyltransferase n=1 Tax=Lapidilactobacillus wuchangensis TaxID=2486001 RepID=UPI000F78A463|nr:GNAT family N-acetyltransferase [Lapidilactobacillus wuchangensis]